ncbi:MAG: cytochrome b/b6 domain-containing protein [Acidocella sp.]|nr:cytochrome b/b6 domain-containing protein [Acidocella sp.]
MAAVDKYTKTAVTLHWLIALFITANVILAIGAGYVPDADVRPMIDLHKSLGITVLGLFIARVLWRLTHKPPPLPAAYRPLEALAAHAAHLALYALILALPVTGWIHDSAWSAAASHPMKLFWIIPWFRLSFITGLDPASKAYVHTLFGHIHTYLSYALYGVLGAHVLGALKHQFFDKHPEIQRMWL